MIQYKLHQHGMVVIPLRKNKKEVVFFSHSLDYNDDTIQITSTWDGSYPIEKKQKGGCILLTFVRLQCRRYLR
nr:MAG TPA: hypothetical protein [Caudoviricetes sp.]